MLSAILVVDAFGAVLPSSILGTLRRETRSIQRGGCSGQDAASLHFSAAARPQHTERPKRGGRTLYCAFLVFLSPPSLPIGVCPACRLVILLPRPPPRLPRPSSSTRLFGAAPMRTRKVRRSLGRLRGRRKGGKVGDIRFTRQSNLARTRRRSDEADRALAQMGRRQP